MVVDQLNSAISSLPRQTSVYPDLARDALVAWQSVLRKGVRAAVLAVGGDASPIDPQLTIRGELSPLFAGMPLGRPGFEAQVTYSGQGLSFEAEFNPSGTFDALADATDADLVRSLIEFFAVPDSRGGLIEVNLPHGDTPELRVESILALLDGEQPVSLDPLAEGWQLEFPGPIDLFGFPIRDVIGIAAGTATDLYDQAADYSQQARTRSRKRAESWSRRLPTSRVHPRSLCSDRFPAFSAAPRPLAIARSTAGVLRSTRRGRDG